MRMIARAMADFCRFIWLMSTYVCEYSLAAYLAPGDAGAIDKAISRASPVRALAPGSAGPMQAR